MKRRGFFRAMLAALVGAPFVEPVVDAIAADAPEWVPPPPPPVVPKQLPILRMYDMTFYVRRERYELKFIPYDGRPMKTVRLENTKPREIATC